MDDLKRRTSWETHDQQNCLYSILHADSLPKPQFYSNIAQAFNEDFSNKLKTLLFTASAENKVLLRDLYNTEAGKTATEINSLSDQSPRINLLRAKCKRINAEILKLLKIRAEKELSYQKTKKCLENIRATKNALESTIPILYNYARVIDDREEKVDFSLKRLVKIEDEISKFPNQAQKFRHVAKTKALISPTKTQLFDICKDQLNEFLNDQFTKFLALKYDFDTKVHFDNSDFHKTRSVFSTGSIIKIGQSTVTKYFSKFYNTLYSRCIKNRNRHLPND